MRSGPSSAIASARLFALGAAVLCLAWPREAQAYLDPLTGSVLIQALIGSVLAALFAVKVYWRKLKAFFGFRPPEEADSSPEEAPAQDEH